MMMMMTTITGIRQNYFVRSENLWRETGWGIVPLFNLSKLQIFSNNNEIDI